MGFIKRIFGGKRRKDRVSVQLPVVIETRKNGTIKLVTHDISESGLRMDIEDGMSLSAVTEGNRDVELGIYIQTEEEPVAVFAELVWTTRQENGGQASGWMFQRFLKDGQDRLAAFLQPSTA